MPSRHTGLINSCGCLTMMDDVVGRRDVKQKGEMTFVVVDVLLSFVWSSIYGGWLGCVTSLELLGGSVGAM